MQRVQLEPNRALAVPGRHVWQRKMPDDHLTPGQQHSRAQMARAQRFHESRVLCAPLGGWTRGKIANGEPAQYLDPRWPDARYRQFETAFADLDAHSSAESQQLANIFGN